MIVSTKAECDLNNQTASNSVKIEQQKALLDLEKKFEA
jgi:hypothetical protein